MTPEVRQLMDDQSLDMEEDRESTVRLKRKPPPPKKHDPRMVRRNAPGGAFTGRRQVQEERERKESPRPAFIEDPRSEAGQAMLPKRPPNGRKP